jgi:HK97 family phage major capsid protein
VTDLGTNGKTLTDYSDILGAITTLRGLNESGTGVALAPRTNGSLQGLQDTLHQPLARPADVAALPFLTSTAIPVNLTKGTSSLASEIYVADWSQCIFATRTQLTIEASRFAADSVSSAMSQRQCWLRGYLRFDVGLKRPKSVVVLNGSL